MNRFFESKGLLPELSSQIFDILNNLVNLIEARKQEARKQENEIKDYIEEIENNDNVFRKSGLHEALFTIVVVYDSEGKERIKKFLKDIDIYYDGNDGELWKDSKLNMNKLNTLKHLTTTYVKEHIKGQRESLRREEEESDSDDSILGGGGMKNQKVKKCEKKKVVLGKERCIYKVSGSKKDYMKYKGKLVPVTDYVKYMKKKN
jgi:hypothetical protein